MKTLILSDVHGNLAALKAVLAEPHDAVICLGDSVGFGPQPGSCVRRIRETGAIAVQGNHDRAIANHEPPGGREPFVSLAAATTPLQHARVDADTMEYLDALPVSKTLDLGGTLTLLVHATPSDPLYRAVNPDAASWAPELDKLDAKLVLVGHTHVQFDLVVGERRVVNPGSVGLPLDGDSRAAYALLEADTITLRRVAYNTDMTLHELARSGLPINIVNEFAGWLRTGRAPRRAVPPSAD